MAAICIALSGFYLPVQLWQEKIGAVEPFTGNQATSWNNTKEEEALERYKLITGNPIMFPEFHISGKYNEEEDWLAASPDGVIDKNFYGLPYKGVLEIKCPFYKGDMRKAYPWSSIPYNCVPQAQGLMEILDRDWMDFYVWTPKGSSLIRVYRDVEYWNVLKIALSDFWWAHVQPAREIYSKYVVNDPMGRIELHVPCPSSLIWCGGSPELPHCALPGAVFLSLQRLGSWRKDLLKILWQVARLIHITYIR
uniref:Restriction endonuclease, type II-like superfamily protein n=1 Tax=Tanacetum cinerariifolium TaxID=118510 RepID=A0A6L2JRD1_TANCI|nr:restriction endonuclease, type II-like superfamily protein [Tanacetum cinerariifolium]